MCLLCDCKKLNKIRYLPPITPAEKRVLEQIREEVQREESYYRAREAEFEKLVLHSLRPVLPLNPLIGPSDDSFESDCAPIVSEEDKPIQESPVDQQDLSYLLGTQYLLENCNFSPVEVPDRFNDPSINFNFWNNLKFENFDI